MMVSRFFRLREHEGQVGLSFWCEGCRGVHGVRVKGSGAWGFNDDYDRPTFTPSVLTTGIAYEIGADGERDISRPIRDAAGERQKLICHTFIADGMVQFLGDCTHSLAGQTRPMVELPDWMRDDPEVAR
ncbi:MAG: putative anaerobic dehydrogenase [Phenylobacterium sp.]|nr:putative anaerobic dehydrogenase [Phenylobacterium sp.]